LTKEEQRKVKRKGGKREKGKKRESRVGVGGRSNERKERQDMTLDMTMTG